ncbi:MAG: hypothetical protein LBQ42_02535 [Synergistaceae bacterium]|jgi:hypothetical protein|nr:hypothetical protein [Synergistaceae bacterium]
MLNFRVQLLRDSGQIGDATAAQVKNLIRFLEESTGTALTEDNAAMLVTHFAVAVERAYRGESVNAMENVTRFQVTASPDYPRAESLLDAWLKAENVPFVHENERDFLLLHLCVFLENQKRFDA